MSDTSKTVAESAFCELLAMPTPTTARDFRRAVIMAALIGRQIEADFQQQNQPTTHQHDQQKTFRPRLPRTPRV